MSGCEGEEREREREKKFECVLCQAVECLHFHMGPVLKPSEDGSGSDGPGTQATDKLLRLLYFYTGTKTSSHDLSVLEPTF